MKNRFFIMLNTQCGDFIQPIIDEEEMPVLYPTLEAAKQAAENHHACEAFGCEIFERGTGS